MNRLISAHFNKEKNMIYRIPKTTEINDIIIMKNNVKKRIIESGMPMWLNGYPLDEMIVEDVTLGDARVIEVDGRVVAYAHFCHASKEYDSKTFKKDNLQTFGRVMVDDGYTGKHIGDFLVKSMIEEAKTLNVEGLCITADDFNIKAVNLYKEIISTLYILLNIFALVHILFSTPP